MTDRYLDDLSVGVSWTGVPFTMTVTMASRSLVVMVGAGASQALTFSVP